MTKIRSAVLLSCMAISACGGSDPAPVTGYFLDSAVEGLQYTSTAHSGKTGSDGGFTCLPGQTVSFKLGGISLGSAPCATTVTPLTLGGGTDARADAVVNRLLLLQALDEDDNPANGIRITDAVLAALGAQTLDLGKAAAQFNSDLSVILPDVKDAFGRSYKLRQISAERRLLASEHFSGTLAALGSAASATRNYADAATEGVVQIVTHSLQASASQFIAYPGSNAAIRADFPKGFFPAVGSGLAFKGQAADGSLEFWGITERGPNGDGPVVSQMVDGVTYAASKVFPAPDFVPSLATIRVGKNGAELVSTLPLKANATETMSGRPIAAGIGSSGELPLTDQFLFNPAKGFTANGLDPESIVIDAARKLLWISDEYGPFIVKVDPTTGQVIRKFGPGAGLPDVLKLRRANRGMEGLSLDTASGKLYGFLQSPIDDGKATDSFDLDQDGKTAGDTVNVRDYAQFIRWVEFDPNSESSSRSFAYPVNFPIAGQKWDRNRSGSIKLGDMAWIAPGKFLFIEQGADANKVVRNFLMLVEIPANATNILAAGSELEKNSIDGTTTSAIAWNTVVPLKKRLLLDLNAAGWLAEKAEGLTLVDGQTVALINDNDFGLRTMLTDANGNEIPGSVEDCSVSTSGALSNCAAAGVTGARLTRATDRERPTRVWLIKFPKALSSYTAS